MGAWGKCHLAAVVVAVRLEDWLLMRIGRGRRAPGALQDKRPSSDEVMVTAVESPKRVYTVDASAHAAVPGVCRPS